jgi:hypothetical protein
MSGSALSFISCSTSVRNVQKRVFRYATARADLEGIALPVPDKTYAWPSVFFVKEIFIYLLKLDGTVQPHADTVFDHQLCKALPIN